MTTVALIVLNVLVFIVLKAIGYHDTTWIDGFIGTAGVSGAASPALGSHPWSVLSYMFVHLDTIHLLVNMLWLLAFGMMLERAFGARSLLLAYLSGGITGAVAFSIIQLASHSSSYLIGSSAAVLCVAMSALCSNAIGKSTLPRYIRIPLTVMAWLAAGLFFITEADGSTTQTTAHLTGTLTGIITGLLLSRQRRQTASVAHTTAMHEAERNALLHKANLSGYATLSAAEREKLFEFSGRNGSAPRAVLTQLHHKHDQTT